jgi:nucleotide-binding universal stress UspA family protein
MSSRRSVVVAGVDGSAASVVALLHAFDEAWTRGASVEMVTVWQDPPSAPSEDRERLYRAGHRWAVRAQLAALSRARRDSAHVPPVTGVVVPGEPAVALARAGEDAVCVVLGRRTDDVLSACESTREQCMALATCPVVVVSSLTRPCLRRGPGRSDGERLRQVAHWPCTRAVIP